MPSPAEGRSEDVRLRNRRLGRILLVVAAVVLSLPFVNHYVRGTPAQRVEDPPSEMVRRAGLLEGRGQTGRAAELYQRVLEIELADGDTLKPLVRAARAGLARIAVATPDSIP